MPQEIAATHSASGANRRSRLRSQAPGENATGFLKDSIASYWKNAGDDEAKGLYNHFLNAKAQLEHLETLKAQANAGTGGKLSANQENNLNQAKQRFENEAETAKQSLLQRLGDNSDARSLLFSEIKQGGPGTYQTLAKEFGAISEDLETPEWGGSYEQLAGKANRVLDQRLTALGGENVPAGRPSPSQEAASTTLPVIASGTTRTPAVADASLMRAAYQAELQQQFQGARRALGQQLQSQADAQRLAFSQEMMPQLTGEGVMMGHFGSSRQGISEGIARGRMESQLASEQAAAVASLESGFAGMQNQWGLAGMAADNQFALQDMAGRQSMAEMGFRSQADMEMARQRGLVDRDLARLQGDVSIDVSRQQNLMNQETSARQSEMQQVMAQQQAMQAFDLEKWRREEELKEKQLLMDREEAGQLRLKSVDAEQAMALEQLRGSQSQNQALLQGQLDMKKAQMAGAFNIFGDMAKVGVMDGTPTPQNQMAAAVRKELGLPEFQPTPVTNSTLYGLNAQSDPVTRRIQNTLAVTRNYQSRLANIR